MTSTETSYTLTAKVLHWLSAIIWLTVWCMGILAVHARSTFNPNWQLTYWHKGIATTLLFLVVIRIIWRLTHTPPALPNTIPPIMKQAAKFGIFLLYLITLIAMPISGWFLSSVAGSPVTVLGLFELPPLINKTPSLSATAMTVHITLAITSIILIAGHILMALKHHFIDHDSVLLSMAPHSSRK